VNIRTAFVTQPTPRTHSCLIRRRVPCFIYSLNQKHSIINVVETAMNDTFRRQKAMSNRTDVTPCPKQSVRYLRDKEFVSRALRKFTRETNVAQTNVCQVSLPQFVYVQLNINAHKTMMNALSSTYIFLTIHQRV